MNDSPRAFLRFLFQGWEEVADQTVLRLGQESASLFLDLKNDALEITGAIWHGYSEEARVQSIVFIEFTGLFKELRWLHALFLSSNYPMVSRQLPVQLGAIFQPATPTPTPRRTPMLPTGQGRRWPRSTNG